MNHNNLVYQEKSTDLDPYTLGYNYQHGIGVEKDMHKAFDYYQKSADMGNVKGIFQIGECYCYGTGVKLDENKAFIYYQKSAEMGDASGIYMVGCCYQNGIGVEEDESKAFIYYQKSAEMGNAEAAFDAGCFYRNGIGVEANENKAFIYYKKSADMGNAGAAIEVGNCYKNGSGVEKDERKAFVYYQKSADMGNAKGMCQVGQCYYDGTGVEKDQQKALLYYQKSAEMGDANGTRLAEHCYAGGIGIIENQNQVVEYYKKAIEVGHVQEYSQKLGDCYRNGFGVPRDIQRANHWYRIEIGTKKISKKSYENVDDNLKKILDDEKYQLSWIPYNELKDIREIGKGGFATVYYAYWHVKGESSWSTVALKLIHGSNKCNQEFVAELKSHCEIRYENPSFLKCYGISRDDESKDYIIVLKYAKEGSLRQNLGSVAKMEWKDKLNLLYCIVSDLESIHSQELIHRDLHSGNILQDYLYSAYITDLGLTTSSDMNGKEEINGVMPYVAPEVLNGKPFTQAADIYSIGVIMSEISTGRRAFDGESFNIKLAVKICQGNKKPEFNKGTPDCYIELAKRCLDLNQHKRPTASVIAHKIGHWLDEMTLDNNNEIKKQFLEADKIKPNIESPKHPNHIYTSKLINTREVTTILTDFPDIEDPYN